MTTKTWNGLVIFSERNLQGKNVEKKLCNMIVYCIISSMQVKKEQSYTKPAI